MYLSSLTNTLTSKQITCLQNCAKLIINTQLRCRKNYHQTFSSLFSKSVTKFPQSVINLSDRTPKSTDLSRNFSSSSVSQSRNFTPNQAKERRRNYIVGTCLTLYILTAVVLKFVLYRSEDIVYVEPEETKQPNP